MKKMKMTPFRFIVATTAVVLTTVCASGYAQTDMNDPAANSNMAGGRPGMPDFAAVAATLGVSEDALHAAMRNAGGPPPDMDKVAAELGVSVDDLKAAMPAPPPRPN